MDSFEELSTEELFEIIIHLLIEWKDSSYVNISLRRDNLSWDVGSGNFSSAGAELKPTLSRLAGYIKNAIDDRQAKDKQITWKDVFDSVRVWRGDRDKACKAAEENGYKYFTWNGWVYDITQRCTKIKVEDLK